MSTLLYETNSLVNDNLTGGSLPPNSGSNPYFEAKGTGPSGGTSVTLSVAAVATEQTVIKLLSDGSLAGNSYPAAWWSVGIQTNSAGSSGGPYTFSGIYLARYTPNPSAPNYSYAQLIGQASLSQTIQPGESYTLYVNANAVTFGAGDILYVASSLVDPSGNGGNLSFTPSGEVLYGVTPPSVPPLPTSYIGQRRRHGFIARQTPIPLIEPLIAGSVPAPTSYIGQRRPHGWIASQTPLPMMTPPPMHPLQPTAFIGQRRRHGWISRQTPLLAPPVPGPVPPPTSFIGARRRHGWMTAQTPLLPVINPLRVAGGVPPPTSFIGQRRRHGWISRHTPLIPMEPQSHLGTLILLRGGPSTSSNIPPPIAREPLYMTDTNQLFVCDGFARHFIGGDFVAAPAHSTSSGIAGQTAWDGTYYYLCVAANTWIRLGGFSTSF